MSLGLAREITPPKSEIIFDIFGFPITNSTLMVWLIMVLLIIFVFFVVRKYREKPGRGQSLVELIYEFILSFIEQITGNRAQAEKIFPIVGTMMVYLVCSNLIGLFPGLTSITWDGVSIFRTPTSDFNVPFGLAVGSVIVMNIVSIKEWGLFGHIGKFFKFKEVYEGFRKGIGEGLISLVDFFVGLLDIIGEIAKVVSLSFRLFGNMYAGEVMMIIMMGAIAYILPSIWLGMSFFTGTLQGIVFSSLVAAYYMLVLKPPEDPKELETKES